MDEFGLAQTQEFFRSVNERILELALSFSVGREPDAEFLCECGDIGCHERLAVSVAEFRRARAAGGHFVVLRGHEDAEAHRVVDELGEALVVELVEERRP